MKRRGGAVSEADRERDRVAQRDLAVHRRQQHLRFGGLALPRPHIHQARPRRARPIVHAFAAIHAAPHDPITRVGDREVDSRATRHRLGSGSVASGHDVRSRPTVEAIRSAPSVHVVLVVAATEDVVGSGPGDRPLLRRPSNVLESDEVVGIAERRVAANPVGQVNGHRPARGVGDDVAPRPPSSSSEPGPPVSRSFPSPAWTTSSPGPPSKVSPDVPRSARPSPRRRGSCHRGC